MLDISSVTPMAAPPPQTQEGDGVCQCEWQEHEPDMQHASPAALLAFLQWKVLASKHCSSKLDGCLPAQASACKAFNSAACTTHRALRLQLGLGLPTARPLCCVPWGEQTSVRQPTSMWSLILPHMLGKPSRQGGNRQS